MTASVADLKFLEIETGTQNISSTPSSSKQKISYLDLGDKNSIPLLFFHGFPGSALQSLIFYPHLESYGVRLIAMNRPGYASSSMMRPTSPKAFVSVVQDFVDALELEKFICVGVSGGNPYAIATASVLKSRVLGLGSICGAAPFNSETMSMMNPLSNLFLSLSKVLPSSVIEVIAGKILNSQEPHKRIVKLLGKLPHVDRALFEDKNLVETMLVSLKHARQQGGAGMSFDLRNFSQDWSEVISQVDCPWTLWHGSEDKVVDPKLSEWVAAKNKIARMRLIPGEGHYSLPIKRGNEILRALIQD